MSILNSKGNNYTWNGVLIVDIWFGEWSWSKYVQGRAQQTKKTWSKIEPHPIFFHKPDPISSAQNEIHVKIFARNWKEIPNFFEILEKAKKKSQKIDQNICSWEWKSPEKNQNNPLHWRFRSKQSHGKQQKYVSAPAELKSGEMRGQATTTDRPITARRGITYLWGPTMVKKVRGRPQKSSLKLLKFKPFLLKRHSSD